MFGLNSNKEKTESLSYILADDSAFAIREAYNTLATNVIHLQLDGGCKKIAITSSTYGEGKSSLAINLAISLALNLLDKKILLVDADLRTPHVKDFLGSAVAFAQNEGLSDFLNNESVENIFAKSHIDNLDIVCAGSSVANPAGLINSEKMSEFIAKCEGKYDYIIIDTPPVNVVSDAVTLADRVNGYIISVKKKVSTTTKLSETSDVLSAVGATVLGVVLV